MKYIQKPNKGTALLIACLLNQAIIAQLPTKSISTLSPNSTQLGAFGTVPVGLFTGTVQESIPIYELKTKNLSLPVSLNYSSNGLIVDKMASWVGYDWSLDAGGVITLSVKGERDNPAWGRDSVPSDIGSDDNILRNFLLTNPSGEFQPDEYCYNFSGYSGKFILNYTGTVASTVPFRKMLIAPYSGTSMFYGTGFIITTDDGVKYTFALAENYTSNYPYSENYPVSWLLTSILHPTGDIITFYYSKSTTSFYTGVSQQVDKVLWWDCPENPCEDYWTFIPGALGRTNEAAYLDSITASGGGTVIFQKSGNRSDYHDGKRLDKIIIKNNRREVIKAIDFSYSYISGHYNYQKPSPLDYYGIQGQYYDTEVNNRLFLNSVTFRDQTDTEVNNYTFQYYNLDYLPSRLCLAQDHWGYFNGAINTDFVPSGYTSYQQFNGIGGNRNPDGSFSQNGMIHTITYPTGGYSVIEYEPNSSDGNQVGGCRVKRISSYKDPSSSPVIKRYYYNNRNNLNTSFGYHYVPYIYFFEYNIFRPCSGNMTQTCHYGRLLSNSQASVYFNNGNSIVYPSVTVSNGENFEAGGETHSFYVESDLPGENLTSAYNGNDVFPTEYSNDSWHSGAKQSEIYFKKNSSGQFVDVKTVYYTYNFEDTRNADTYVAIAVTKKPSPDPPIIGWDELNNYDVVKYFTYTRWEQPVSTTITEYDDNGNTTSSVTTYTYSNPDHTQLTDETSSNSRGESVVKKYYYPQSYNSGVQNFSTLIGKFILNQPIDKRIYSNSKLIQLEQFKYNNYGQTTDYYNADLDRSGTDITFNMSSPYTATHKETLTYDGSLNLILSTPDDNITTSYIWGYSSMYPVIKADNINQSTLQTAVDNALPTGYSNLEQLLTSGVANMTTDTQKNLWKTFCSNLVNQSSLSNASVTTYTYRPQVGMTSQTDPNGIALFYEYDTVGRLQFIKDHDGRILKSYEYNYSN